MRVSCTHACTCVCWGYVHGHHLPCYYNIILLYHSLSFGLSLSFSLVWACLIQLIALISSGSRCCSLSMVSPATSHITGQPASGGVCACGEGGVSVLYLLTHLAIPPLSLSLPLSPLPHPGPPPWPLCIVSCGSCR